MIRQLASSDSDRQSACRIAGWTLPSGMLTVREYLDLRGRNPWDEWFESLDAPAEPQITAAKGPDATGNISGTKVPEPGAMNAGSDLPPDNRLTF